MCNHMRYVLIAVIKNKITMFNQDIVAINNIAHV